MSGDLWFRFRPARFMAEIRGLSANEVKVLLCVTCRIMETGGPVRADREILSTYCEMRPSSFDKALDRLLRLEKLFLDEDGCLTNDECEREISWRVSKSQNAERAGKKSAEKRQQNQRGQATDVERPFNHIDKIREDKNISPPYIPPRRRERVAAPDGAVLEFDRVWSLYPRKVGKGAAEKAWLKARRSASFDEIAGPLAAFCENIRGTEQRFIPHLATWLNQRRWEDDQTHAANRNRTSDDDLRHLATIREGATAEDDLARLFDSPKLRLVAQ